MTPISLSVLLAEHRTALRMAWLDLCHAHEAISAWEPAAGAAIIAITTKLIKKYPELQATLMHESLRDSDCDNTPTK